MDAKQSIYDPVSAGDDREELLSSTDVDDSLMGDEEKQWHSQQPDSRRQSKRNRFISTFKSNQWLIGTSLQLVIVALLVLILLQGRGKEADRAQVGGDYTGVGPILPTKVVKFDADAEFVPMNSSEFFSDKTLEKWKTLLPAGSGWGNSDFFSTTSMTHQLHCLYMMGRIFAGLDMNLRSNIPKDYESHYIHCIDYLRQSIMCSGDVATEPHKPTDSEDNGPLDGSWGGLHVCKDYGHVIGYLEEQIADGVRVVLPIDD